MCLTSVPLGQEREVLAEEDVADLVLHCPRPRGLLYAGLLNGVSRCRGGEARERNVGPIRKNLTFLGWSLAAT